MRKSRQNLSFHQNELLQTGAFTPYSLLRYCVIKKQRDMNKNDEMMIMLLSHDIFILGIFLFINDRHRSGKNQTESSKNAI